MVKSLLQQNVLEIKNACVLKEAPAYKVFYPLFFVLKANDCLKVSIKLEISLRIRYGPLAISLRQYQPRNYKFLR